MSRRGVSGPGERAVVDNFTFANPTLCTGLRHRWNGGELQSGLEVHTVRYWLTQNDGVDCSDRKQYEGWSAWNLAWVGP